MHAETPNLRTQRPSWLAGCIAAVRYFGETPTRRSGPAYKKQRRLHVESLECRNLLAGNITFDAWVSSSSDDAEERANGDVNLTSSDLELTFDRSNQTVGVRFTDLAIPVGSSVTDAYIQFQADESHSGSTSLTIEGQAADNAATFVTESNNVSVRPRTSAAASWTPAPWTAAGDSGPDQRTPNIASIIQEIVERPGWSSGNSLVLLITGTGERAAESYDGNQAGAPLLHVEYMQGPVAVDDAVSTDEETVLNGNVLAANPETPDIDPDGDPLTVSEVNGVAADVGNQITLASGALLRVNANGTFDYDPNGQFESLAEGETTLDTFSYTVSDGNGGSDTAMVDVTITGVNGPPLAVDDAVSTDDNSTLNGDVLAANPEYARH